MFIVFIILSSLPFTFQSYTMEDVEKIPNVDFCMADAKDKSQISCYLFKSDSQPIGIPLTEEYVLPEDDRRKPTKLFLHSRLQNISDPWYREMRKQYFEKGPHNIIFVDWAQLSNKTYTIAAANVKPAGEWIADLLTAIKVPPKNLHIIGQGIGAHLAGFIGRNVKAKTGHKVGRITGSDPAGPLFEHVGPEARLSRYDADFVDAIHTDIGFHGIIKPVGHVDFYANSGRTQPKCPVQRVDNPCNSRRATYLFMESIGKHNITAKRMKLDQVGKVIPLPKAEEAEFGDSMPTNVRGMYQFFTNYTSPYLISKKK